MSSGQKVSWGKARNVAEEMVDYLVAYANKIEIAGSVRRKKAEVGDIEIVMLAQDHSIALDHLDSMERRGIVQKADYGNGHRWGDKYRGMDFQGMRVEVFFANEHNWGYQLWLRTGPGDANQYVMQRLQSRRSALRFSEGMGWITGYRDDVAEYHQPVSIPDEMRLFLLLGLPYMAPEARTLQKYQQHELRPVGRDSLKKYEISADDARRMPGQGKQLRMF